MTTKILLTRMWPDTVLRRLQTGCEVVVDPKDRPLTAAMLREATQQFDVICPTVSDRLGADIFEAHELRTRLMANYGVGFDHIDLTAARARGVTVTNTPGVLTESTADLAILLILMTSRRAGEGERELRSERWAGWRPTHMVGQSLSGKLLGLVGFGRIARATAARARALGMQIAYHGRRRADPVTEEAFAASFHEDLDGLAAVADVLSLHCPGGEETRHLVDAKLLGRMKPTAVLINTARGSVVDEAALGAALAQRRIWAAGLDVYEREPEVDPTLRGLENVVLLPHLGSATLETRTAMGMRAADNIDRFLQGETPPDRVN